jgi:hypothetical protein
MLLATTSLILLMVTTPLQQTSKVSCRNSTSTIWGLKSQRTRELSSFTCKTQLQKMIATQFRKWLTIRSAYYWMVIQLYSKLLLHCCKIIPQYSPQR